MSSVLLLLLPLLACSRPPPPTVVMISIDTARADAFSCYADESHWGLDFPAESRPVPATPSVDGLAAAGVRFSWALAQAPTTLSSHTTVFSGEDPHAHGVVRNGYAVDPKLPVLAERLASAGWDTLAILGSSALERKMGLDRGFGVYDDPGAGPAGGMLMRGADEVTRRALAAVDDHRADPARSDKPLFLFVHYYDPHMPWFTAPERVVRAFTRPSYTGPIDGTMGSVGLLTRARRTGTLRYGDARQARGLYLAQVAWVDEQIAALLAGIDQRGLAGDRLVVTFSDHGEVLEESARQPYTHGPSTVLTAIHVPLIFSGRGRFALPATVVPQPVRLMDIAPTVLSLLGLDSALGDGIDLAALWQGQELPGLTIFSEATKPMSSEATNAWNNLPFDRSVVRDGIQLRVQPLEQNRASLNRIAPGAPGLGEVPQLDELAGLLRAWDQQAPAYRPPEYDAETEAALRALGYLDGAPSGAP